MRSTERARRRRNAWTRLFRVFALALAPVLLGVALVFAPPDFGMTGVSSDLLRNVGYGLLGSAVSAAIVMLFVGGETINQQDVIEQALESISSLVRQARKLGVVALALSRDSNEFEEGKPLVERWRYLLRNADQVDLLCMDDSVLLSDGLLNSISPLLRKRLNDDTHPLSLRILLATEANEGLPLISAWAATPDYAQQEVLRQYGRLKRLGFDRPEVLRRHDKLVPFTMVRGDTYMYVMFFLPGGTRGPVIELRQREALDASAAQADPEDDLFNLYVDLFEKWWKKPESDRTSES